MVGRKCSALSLIAAALLGARSVTADPITLTGNVATDFNPADQPRCDRHPGQRTERPDHIAQPAWMTSAGLVSGLEHPGRPTGLQCRTDTMYVGVNTYGVAGNVDGNGTPGSPTPD